jgi:SAM-dependent methyltransferase
VEVTVADRALNPRQALLWGMYDFSRGHGLEIGPLHACIAPREHADVRYVDVFDREQLVANTLGDDAVDSDLIPEIDFPLFDGERVRSIPEVIGPDERFDWVMASHVIEHVPDLIGWLGQIAQVTADGGDLVLAIPDRRYCFDLHRPGTSLGQVLQAHELGETTPSVRAVYDYKRGHARVDTSDIWAGRPAGYETRIHALETVQDFVDRARKGEYIDSHVWLFTPGTFLEQIVELRRLGLSEWRVSHLAPTKQNELEFYAVLTRLPRGDDWPDELFADEPVPPAMPDWLSEWAQLRTELDASRAREQALHDDLATVQARKRKLRKKTKALRSDKKALRKRNAKLERRERRRLPNRIRARLRRFRRSSSSD